MSGPYFCFMTTYVNSHVCEPVLKYIKWECIFVTASKFILLCLFSLIYSFFVCFMCCHKWFPINSQARAEELISEYILSELFKESNFSFL